VGFVSLAAPAGTPKHIVHRLNEGLGYALETPSVKQRFDELSTPILIMTPAQTKAFVESEQKRWWPLVRALRSCPALGCCIQLDGATAAFGIKLPSRRTCGAALYDPTRTSE